MKTSTKIVVVTSAGVGAGILLYLALKKLIPPTPGFESFKHDIAPTGHGQVSPGVILSNFDDVKDVNLLTM